MNARTKRINAQYIDGYNQVARALEGFRWSLARTVETNGAQPKLFIIADSEQPAVEVAAAAGRIILDQGYDQDVLPTRSITIVATSPRSKHFALRQQPRSC